MPVSPVRSQSNTTIPINSDKLPKKSSPRKIRRQQGTFAIFKRMVVGALALQGTSMVPKAEGIGTFTCLVCLAGGGGPVCIPPCALAILTPTITLG